MGGSVRVAVRTPERTRVVVGWTNSLSSAFNQVKFIDGDPAVWDFYLDFYEKEPRNSHPKKANLIAPEEYGLIVVDYTTKIIYSMQGYVKPTYMSARYPEEDNYANEDHPGLVSNEADVRTLIRRNALFFVTYSERRGTGSRRITSLPMLRRCRDEGRLYEIYVDISPWRVFTYPQTTTGIRGFRRALQDAGFEIAPAAGTIWDKWIKGAQEDEET